MGGLHLSAHFVGEHVEAVETGEAWPLAQRADLAPDFQRQALELLTAAVAASVATTNAEIRCLGERAMTTLKGWRLLRKLR